MKSKIAKDAHFDGHRFHNLNPLKVPRSGVDLMRWLATRKPAQRPSEEISSYSELQKEPVEPGECRVTFINHSTVLCQFHNLTVLFDPIWSKRCGPTKWLGVKRIKSPGIKFEDLPKIDLVLISHNHYDHLDLPTLKRLFKKHDPEFIVPVGVGKILKKQKLTNVSELDWWQQKQVSNFEVHFVPAQHFSRRGAFDLNKTLWGGFVITWEGLPIYFAGDTGYGPHFKEIFDKFGKLSLAMLPIGAYKPRWFMEAMHMSPKDALLAHLDLQAKKSLGIHFGTFPLGDEGSLDPVKDLKNELLERKISPKDFLSLNNGEQFLIK